MRIDGVKKQTISCSCLIVIFGDEHVKKGKRQPGRETGNNQRREDRMAEYECNDPSQHRIEGRPSRESRLDLVTRFGDQEITDRVPAQSGIQQRADLTLT